MDCITDILTEKIFAFSGGDIMCQSSSQIADKLASTQRPSQRSLVLLYYTLHSAWAWALRKQLQEAPLVQVELVSRGGRAGLGLKKGLREQKWPGKSTVSCSWTMCEAAVLWLWSCGPARAAEDALGGFSPPPWYYLHAVPQGKKRIAKSVPYHQPIKHP